MIFGMPTLVELGTVREHAKLASSEGLGFIEINMSFPQYTKDSLDINELLRIKEEYGISYTIHADEFLNPFDFNYKISDAYFGVMRDTLEVAKAIGAPVVNLHLQKGIYVTLPERVILLTDVYEDKYLESVKRFIALCEQTVEGGDVRIAIENVDSNPFTSSQLKALELFMKSPVFALTLDTGHEFALGFCDEHVYRKYPERIIHMHLHDCIGKKPHQPLGVGGVDVKGKISSFCGKTCLIEVKTVSGLKESVAYLKDNRLYSQG